MIKEFRDFVMRGNVIDMAVGIIVGASFNSIVSSLVNDVIMPPIGALMGNVNFSDFYLILKQSDPAISPDTPLAAAQAAGAVTLNYGMFINTIINFLIVAMAVFMMVKGINQLHREKPAEPAKPDTKECPFCFSTISIKATRCPSCTSEIKKK